MGMKKKGLLTSGLTFSYQPNYRNFYLRIWNLMEPKETFSAYRETGCRFEYGKGPGQGLCLKYSVDDLSVMVLRGRSLIME